MRPLKIQSKSLLNMKMVVNYLNVVFHIEVKASIKFWILFFNLLKTRNGTWDTRTAYIFVYHFADQLLLFTSKVWKNVSWQIKLLLINIWTSSQIFFPSTLEICQNRYVINGWNHPKQKCIWDFIKHLWWSFFDKIVNFYCLLPLF